jgi:hypothetical protein
MKRNDIEIDFNNYNEALEKSLYDQDWVRNLYTDKENVCNLLEISNNNPKIIAEINREKNIKSFIKAIKDDPNKYYIIERFMNAGSAEENNKFIQRIKNITEQKANIVKLLLNEYSFNTRNFIKGVMQPFPESINDTWKPITSFKIKTNDKKEFVLKIEEDIITTCDKDKNIKTYFESRNKNKNIKRCYANNISENEYNKIRRELLYLKECEINTKYLTNEEDSKYKILFKGNQTVANNKYEVSVYNQNIKVLHIMENNYEKK